MNDFSIIHDLEKNPLIKNVKIQITSRMSPQCMRKVACIFIVFDFDGKTQTFACETEFKGDFGALEYASDQTRIFVKGLMSDKERDSI